MRSVWIIRCYNLARIIFVVFGIHDTHLHFRYYIYKFTIILSINFKKSNYFQADYGISYRQTAHYGKQSILSPIKNRLLFSVML
jgi:hypothetical protein